MSKATLNAALRGGKAVPSNGVVGGLRATRPYRPEATNTRRLCAKPGEPCERWYWAGACHYPWTCQHARPEDDTANTSLSGTETAAGKDR